MGRSRPFSVVSGLVLTVTALLMTPRAQAELISFAYNNLTGQYVTAGNHFTAVSQSGLLSQPTDLLMSRLEPVTGAAQINWSLPHGVATFELDLTLNAVTAFTANASGTLLIRDVDGDEFTADVTDGTWIKLGTYSAFGGALTNVLPVTSGNSTFDGTGGSGFSMAFSEPPPYAGAVISLVFSGWFTDGSGVPQAFDDKVANGSGTIAAVPEPATLLLFLLPLATLRRHNRVA